MFLIGRTQLLGPDDQPALAEVMQQYRIEPMAVHQGGEAPELPPFDWPHWDDEASRDERFIGYLNALLPLCEPVHPDEAAMFDRFAIPGVEEWPGNTTFIKSVVVSGSLEGPDTGYQELAAFELETHGPDQEFTEQVPTVLTPVRWVKVRFDGGINIEPGDEGNTALRFTELIGNGTQDPSEFSNAFTGVWSFKLTERLDGPGKPLELHQTGATISGCLDTILISGTVNGRIARATGVDPARNDRPSAFIFVADEDDSIQAVWSENNGVFGALQAW